MPGIRSEQRLRLGILGLLLVASLVQPADVTAVESRLDANVEGRTITHNGAMLGDPASFCNSGGNATGTVDLADYPVRRNNLGAYLSEFVSTGSVPEPRPWMLGILAAICGLLFKWLV